MRADVSGIDSRLRPACLDSSELRMMEGRATGSTSRAAQFFRPAQTLSILAGRRAKQPPILPAELRGAVIPHGIANGGDVLR
jgi:hypothetical protein